MRITGIQSDIVWEDPSANFDALRPRLSRAAEEGARLCVLPEMFATGFSMAADLVAPKAGEIRSFLAEEASRLGLWILGGFAEPGEPRPRNAAALFDPQGRERLLYHKVHPFSLAGENEVFEAGCTLETLDVEGLRVTPLICYDLRFPEPFRRTAEGTDLFCVIANWPVVRSAAWRTLLRARAMENQAFVLGVNRVGEGSGLVYRGDSALIDPMGEVIAAAAWQEAEVSGTVGAAQVRACRERFSFLADRRVDLYPDL